MSMHDTASCHRADAWMALETAGVLTRTEKAALDEHVGGCESCRLVRIELPGLVPSRPSRSRRHARVAMAAVTVLALAAALTLAVRSTRTIATIAPESAPLAAAAVEPAPRSMVAAPQTPSASLESKPTPTPSVEAKAPPSAPVPARGTEPLERGESLTPSQVSLVVAGARADVSRTCWAPREAKAEALGIAALRVELSLTIAPSGKVGRAEQRTSDRRLEDVGACIATRAKAWQFPEAPGPSRVTLPFVFRPDSGY